MWNSLLDLLFLFSCCFISSGRTVNLLISPNELTLTGWRLSSAIQHKFKDDHCCYFMPERPNKCFPLWNSCPHMCCWCFCLQSECHPDTCTQMTATEQWIFLCAAHKTPKEVSPSESFVTWRSCSHWWCVFCLCVAAIAVPCHWLHQAHAGRSCLSSQ